MPNNISSEISNKLSTLSPPTHNIYASASLNRNNKDVNNDAIVLSGWVPDISIGIAEINTRQTGIFKAQTNGWYMLGFSFEIQATDQQTENLFQTAILRIRKDDINYHELENKDGGTGKNKFSVTFGGSFLIELNVGQYISFITEVDSADYNVTGRSSLVKVS